MTWCPASRVLGNRFAGLDERASRDYGQHRWGGHCHDERSSPGPALLSSVRDGWVCRLHVLRGSSRRWGPRYCAILLQFGRRVVPYSRHDFPNALRPGGNPTSPGRRLQPSMARLSSSSGVIGYRVWHLCPGAAPGSIHLHPAPPSVGPLFNWLCARRCGIAVGGVGALPAFAGSAALRRQRLAG